MESKAYEKTSEAPQAWQTSEKPNWSFAMMNIVLPTKNVEKLKNMFVNTAEEKTLDKSKCFSSAFLNRCDTLDEDKPSGLSLIQIQFNCAWGIDTALLSVYPEKYKRPSLRQAVEELGIVRLSGFSQERKGNKAEKVRYDQAKKGLGVVIEEQPLFDEGCVRLSHASPSPTQAEETAQPEETDLF